MKSVVLSILSVASAVVGQSDCFRDRRMLAFCPQTTWRRVRARTDLRNNKKGKQQ